MAQAKGYKMVADKITDNIMKLIRPFYIGFQVTLVIALLVIWLPACIPKQPIEPTDIEILESLAVDGLNLTDMVIDKFLSGEPWTADEIAMVKKIRNEDIESFKAVMARIKASEGESLAYKLLEKILLGLM